MILRKQTMPRASVGEAGMLLTSKPTELCQAEPGSAEPERLCEACGLVIRTGSYLCCTSFSAFLDFCEYLKDNSSPPPIPSTSLSCYTYIPQRMPQLLTSEARIDTNTSKRSRRRMKTSVPFGRDTKSSCAQKEPVSEHSILLMVSDGSICS